MTRDNMQDESFCVSYCHDRFGVHITKKQARDMAKKARETPLRFLGWMESNHDPYSWFSNRLIELGFLHADCTGVSECRLAVELHIFVDQPTGRDASVFDELFQEKWARSRLCGSLIFLSPINATARRVFNTKRKKRNETN